MDALNNKIPPPIILLFHGIALWLVVGTAQLTSSSALLGGVTTILGIGVCLSGVWCFHQRQTTVNPLVLDKTSYLVKEGIFQWTRNPMYLGMLIVLMGWGLMLNNLLTLLFMSSFVAYLTRFQIRPEENALKKRFGAHFEAYCQQVNRWL